jgi:hypothetical protein
MVQHYIGRKNMASYSKLTIAEKETPRKLRARHLSAEVKNPWKTTLAQRHLRKTRMVTYMRRRY